MVIALGVTLKGEQLVLSFVQTATQNERVCRQFLRSLLERGLHVDQGVLSVIDGTQGLPKAADKVVGVKGLRCSVVWGTNVGTSCDTCRRASRRGSARPLSRRRY